MCGVSSIYPSSHSVNIDDWLEFYFGDNIIIKFRQALHSFVEKSVLNPRHSFEKDNLVIRITWEHQSDRVTRYFI